jgi:hypothetical protein
MKNTLNVPFQVILCPACCNFPAHLNIFIAATYAGEYADEQRTLSERQEKNFIKIDIYCFIS